jgi:hypothetical protein
MLRLPLRIYGGMFEAPAQPGVDNFLSGYLPPERVSVLDLPDLPNLPSICLALAYQEI